MMQDYAHQSHVYAHHRDDVALGLWWEQGTGKSRATLRRAVHLIETGKIDTVVIVAPGGVHTNWVVNEVPAHAPELADMGAVCLAVTSQQLQTRGMQRKLDAARRARALVVATTYSTWMTHAGRAMALGLLKRRRCMLVLDEAHRIKNPTAQRTRAILADGKLAAYRMVLTGTPVASSPLDAWAQVQFLDPTIWRRYGCASWTAFKHRYAVFEQIRVGGGRIVQKLISYQRTDELTAILHQVGSRVLKEDVLDLPPKVYTRRYYEMTAHQKRVYGDLLRDKCHEDLETGVLVTPPTAMTAALRMQQVLCGYYTDDDGVVHETVGGNPRLDATIDAISDGDLPATVWVRQTRDIDAIVAACAAAGYRVASYDGRTSDADRTARVSAFQAGELDVLVLNVAMSEGITLTRARQVVYHSNTYRLVDRLQSEDRAHRLGQTGTVLYVDIVCDGTLDAHVAQRLAEKRSISDLVLDSIG